jgi:hypothetical protein
MMTPRTLMLLGSVAILVILALSAGSGPGRIETSGVAPRHVSPFTPPVIDPQGGCEGGSCVNILRW